MPQLRSAQAGINAGKASVGFEKSGYLPSLSLFGGYSIGKPNRDVFNANWDGYFTVGAGVSWSFNLGDQTGRKVRAAEFQLNALEQERDRVRRELDEAARLSYEQMSLAHERFQSAQDQYQITSANYRLAQQRRPITVWRNTSMRPER
jgi:outer membrane protein TolC